MAKSVQSKIKSSARKTAKEVAKKHPVLTFFILIIFALCVIGGYYAYNKFIKPKPIPITGELSVHFLELGNEYAGDCIYIKAGEKDILVDAGSRAESVPVIDDYLDDYVTDNKLEFVIVTHADQDHIAGFAASQSIFDLYECETIIDFNRSNKPLTTEGGNPSLYAKYLAKRDAEVADGASHYTALDCIKGNNGAKKEYELTDSIRIEILEHLFYEEHSSDENNYSVCFLLKHGERNFLFTGDLEGEGEASLIEKNSLPQVELFKAGHHGSKTSSTSALLSIIKPKIVTVTCVAGSVEYTQNFPNTFPTQDMINRVASHTEKVYVTSYIDLEYSAEKEKWLNSGEEKSLNGNIVVSSSADSDVSVTCSVSNTVLKDTEWFKANRETPPAWN